MSADVLYQAYRAERDAGFTHAQIVASGVYPEAEAYCLRYDLAIAAYADAMRQRQERDNIGDLDTYGRPLRDGS